MSTFVCVECGKVVKEEDRVFVGVDWCEECIEKEQERHAREDVMPGATNRFANNLKRMFNIDAPVYRRPPKYALKPDEYRRWGY